MRSFQISLAKYVISGANTLVNMRRHSWENLTYFFSFVLGIKSHFTFINLTAIRTGEIVLFGTVLLAGL